MANSVTSVVVVVRTNSDVFKDEDSAEDRAEYWRSNDAVVEAFKIDIDYVRPPRAD